MLQKVVRSAILDAPIARVWAVLRDFNSHDQWHAVVERSRIEHGEPSSRVGCVRSFTLKDGNRIREQLLGLSDSEHRSTYCILDATLPMSRYVRGHLSYQRITLDLSGGGQITDDEGVTGGHDSLITGNVNLGIAF